MRGPPPPTAASCAASRSRCVITPTSTSWCAFRCALHRPSREEALIFRVGAGGDTGTNAAVAGALLGARDGEASLPPRWLEQLGAARGVATLAERLIEAASRKP